MPAVKDDVKARWERLRLSSISLEALKHRTDLDEATDALKELVREEVVTLAWIAIMAQIESGGVVRPGKLPSEWLCGQALHDVIGLTPAMDIVLYAQFTAPAADKDQSLEAFRSALVERLKRVKFLGYPDEAPILEVVQVLGGGQTFKFVNS